ncbi:MAG: hypothetical protein WBE16_03200, partial [Candidatus Sulfotelmatobacter sp.]
MKDSAGLSEDAGNTLGREGICCRTFYPMSDLLPTESIIVRGARVHNLKNIDFEVAHNTLT